MLRMSCIFILSVGWLASAVFGQTTPAAQSEQDQVLAQVEGKPILTREVLDRAAPEVERMELELLAQQARLQRARYDQIRLQLTLLIADRLVEYEAEKQSTTVEALYAANVTPSVGEPEADSIRAYYDANKSRIKKPLEEVSGEIAKLLKSQSWQAERRRYIEGLWAKSEVREFLAPYRVGLKTAGLPAIGPPEAPVELVVFSDYECRYCLQLEQTLKQITSHYGNKVRLIYRHFPVAAVHPHARAAAEAALCAAEQGRFWNMHDKLFQQPTALAVEELKVKAAEIGLDSPRFNQCLDTGRYAASVSASIREGIAAGVDATPALFVNGRPLGHRSGEKIAAVIDEELAAAAK